MISNNREDYCSADEWLSALKQDELWLSQLQQLQNSTPEDASTLRDKANEKIGKGEAYGFWDSYNHQIEPVVREVWEIAELSLPKLKIQTIGMLSMEWLEQHTEMGRQVSERIKKPSSKQPKTAKPKGRKPSGKPLTMRYYTHGNKGFLKKQDDRLKLVFDKWNKWGWIDSETTTDDFDAFFEGDPRHCNITWKASTTVLTFLLQELLKQPYIAKQTRQSPSSMVREQFGLTPNFDQNRLTDDDKFRIEVTIFLLDINNPLPLIKGGDDEDYDIKDAAFQAVLSGHLRKTKGI